VQVIPIGLLKAMYLAGALSCAVRGPSGAEKWKRKKGLHVLNLLLFPDLPTEKGRDIVFFEGRRKRSFIPKRTSQTFAPIHRDFLHGLDGCSYR
jgi:hypothetical protein